jgi:hypothetical protein
MLYGDSVVHHYPKFISPMFQGNEFCDRFVGIYYRRLVGSFWKLGPAEGGPTEYQAVTEPLGIWIVSWGC